MELSAVYRFSRSVVIVSGFAVVLAFAPAPVAAEAPATDVDSTRLVVDGDSTAEAHFRDEEGQDFNSLFEDMATDGFMDVDTSFAWSNHRINSGRFDYKALGPGDTIKIPLVDSTKNKFFAHPFPNYVAARFGLRRFLWHYGVDIKLHTGDTVRCAMDGIVRVIQFDRRGYGNVVVVRHHNGLETVYGHLSKVKVSLNQKIKAADMVGLGGNTGRSTGPHLHFETRYFGEPFNPAHIIDFETQTLRSDTLLLTSDNFEYLTEARKIVYHTVRKGETLGGIAKRYGTTVSKLCGLNAITSKTILSIGRRIIIKNGKTAEREVIPAQTAAPVPPEPAAAAQTALPPDTAAESGEVVKTVRADVAE